MGKYLIAYPLEIEYSQSWNSVCEPLAVPLLLSDRVTEQAEVFEVFHIFQRFEIAQFGDVVIREY